MSGCCPPILTIYQPTRNGEIVCPTDRDLLRFISKVNDTACRCFEDSRAWWEENKGQYTEVPTWHTRLKNEARRIMDETRADFLAFRERATQETYSVTLKSRKDITTKTEALHFRLAEIQMERVTSAREDARAIDQMRLEEDPPSKKQKSSADDSCLIS